MTVAGSKIQPVEIEVRKSSELRIRWGDGAVGVIPLAQLRGACPCATCRAWREEQGKKPLAVLSSGPRAADMALVDGAEMVGHYALRIRWKDGHDTGIYEFATLRELSRVDDKPTGDVSCPR